MSDTSRDKKLRQYKALLERARHPETPEHEVQACLIQAYKLQAKYNLSEDEKTREERLTRDIVDGKVYHVHGKLHPDLFHIHVINTVAGAFRCESYVVSHEEERFEASGPFAWLNRASDTVQSFDVFLVGVEADVRLGGEYLQTAFAACGNLAASYVRSIGSARGAEAGDNYRLGFAIGLKQGLEGVQQEMGLMLMPPKDAIMRVDSMVKAKGQIMTAKADVDLDDGDNARDLIAGVKDGRQFASGTKGVTKPEVRESAGSISDRSESRKALPDPDRR